MRKIGLLHRIYQHPSPPTSGKRKIIDMMSLSRSDLSNHSSILGACSALNMNAMAKSFFWPEIRCSSQRFFGNIIAMNQVKIHCKVGLSQSNVHNGTRIAIYHPARICLCLVSKLI